MLALGSALLDVASADAQMLWSSELASDAQAHFIAHPLRQTPKDVVPMPTQVTHVTGVLTTQGFRPASYGRPVVALIVAAVIVLFVSVPLVFLSRGPQIVSTAKATAASTTKVAVHKDDVVTMDTVGDGKPNAFHGAADPLSAKGRSFSVSPASAKPRPPLDARRALPAANAAMGTNEAPILE